MPTLLEEGLRVNGPRGIHRPHFGREKRRDVCDNGGRGRMNGKMGKTKGRQVA